MRIHRIVFLLAAVLSCPSLAAAQALTGSITGTVADSSEARLPGVTVTLAGEGILNNQSIVSSETGEYRFPALPPGRYVLKFELQGFTPLERSGVLVSLGGSTRIDVVLQPAALAETVVVSGTSPTVDVETSRVGTNFTPQALQAVPFERDLYDVLKSTPGVVNDNVTYRATSSVNGAGPRNTGYAMDGIAMTDPAAAYTGVRHLNFDTVEEVEVMTGAMPAEVGSVSGGFVNIVTKSGGNDFHGGGSFYFADKSMQSGLRDEVLAAGIAKNSNGIDRFTDLTGELGGPIARNRVWFYGSVRRFDNDTLFIGYRFQPQTIPEDNTITFGKGTLQLNQAHKLTLAATYTNRYQPFFVSFDGGPFRSPAATWQMVDQGPNVNTQWQWIINQATYFDTRFGAWLKRSDFRFQDSSTNPATMDLSTNEWTEAHQREQRDDRHRYQFNAALSFFKDRLAGGTHDFKLGADLVFIPHKQTDRSLAGYSRMLTAGAPTFLTFENDGGDGLEWRARINEYGLFVQDRWTVKRLTVNAGVRLDLTDVSFPAQEFGATGIFPELQAISIYQPLSVPETNIADWRDFSPRLGLVFDLTGNGKTPLKASYSRYNDQVFVTQFLGRYPISRRTSQHRWTDLDNDLLADPGEFGPALSVSGTSGPSDPNLQRAYWNEYILGVEREVVSDVSVGVRVMYKTNKDIVDSVDVGTGDHWIPVTIFDSGPDGVTGTSDDVGSIGAFDVDPAFLGRNLFTSTNPDGAVRRYKAVDFSMTKRLSHGWQMFSSLVLSRAEGNISNDYGGTGATSGAFTNPNAKINGFGRLGLDSPYQLKLGGTYDVRGGIQLGGLFTYFSGYPYTRTIRATTTSTGQRLNVGTITISAEPRGSRRLPSMHQLNLNVAKTFRLPSGQRLKLMADAFNVTNENTTTAIATLSSSTFGRVTSVLAPRYLRLGVRYQF